jgi:hypothetical protein
VFSGAAVANFVHRLSSRLLWSKFASHVLHALPLLQEESIITAAIEADTAAARAATGGLSRNARTRATSHASLLDGRYDAFDAEFGQMSLEDERMRPVKPAGRSSSFSASGSRAAAIAATAEREAQAAGAGDRAAGDEAAGAAAVALLGKRVGGGSSCSSEATALAQQQQQQQSGEAGNGEQQQDDREEEEKETLHRLCPTYASDVNSPLRHVRTRIYFTSESHIHSLVNVLRYCHLPPPPGSTGAAAVANSTRGLNTPTSSISPCPSVTAGMTAAAVHSNNSSPTPGASGGIAAECSAGAAAATVTAAGSGGVFVSAAAAAAVGAATDAASGRQQQQQQGQPLITSEAEALLADTSEFDYLTHIVFRMYENKQVRGVILAMRSTL